MDFYKLGCLAAMQKLGWSGEVYPPGSPYAGLPKMPQVKPQMSPQIMDFAKQLHQAHTAPTPKPSWLQRAGKALRFIR